MFARQVTARIKEGKLEKALTIYEESIIPEGKVQQGYRGIYVMTDREVRKVISITLWDSVEDIVANETSGYYQAQVDKFKGLLENAPEKEIFEVTVMLTKAK